MSAGMHNSPVYDTHLFYFIGNEEPALRTSTQAETR